MTMLCHESEWPGTEEYLERFRWKADQLHIPLAGSLELTHGCNLNCVHCYLGSQNGRLARGKHEMGADRIHRLIDEITAAGCLNLLITGGEPLGREDFPDIYRHAKENGLLVTVFTNGTMVTDEIVRLFRDLPPVEVEISIYGSTAPTYESVTRVAGSYDRCIQGIRSLLDRGVRVNLKTILMTINRHELTDMEGMAKDLGVRFRFDASISPRMDGDKGPVGLRVPPEEAIEKEFSDRDRAIDWKKFNERFQGHPSGNALYICGAGRASFHLDPYGGLRPCLMTLDIRYDISEAGFLEGWANIAPRIRGRQPGAGFACLKCDKINLCGYCPAFFRLETGFEDDCSEYLCKMGRLRLQHIRDFIIEGDDCGKHQRT